MRRQARKAVARHLEPIEGWQVRTSHLAARLASPGAAHSDRLELLIEAKDLLTQVQRAFQQYELEAGHLEATTEYQSGHAAFGRLVETLSKLG